MKMYRIVCKGDDGEITLRTKGKDQYDAFERTVMFLREKKFDYQVVLVESYGPALPHVAHRASSLR